MDLGDILATYGVISLIWKIFTTLFPLIVVLILCTIVSRLNDILVGVKFILSEIRPEED